jgi:hypothetical protein
MPWCVECVCPASQPCFVRPGLQDGDFILRVRRCDGFRPVWPTHIRFTVGTEGDAGDSLGAAIGELRLERGPASFEPGPALALGGLIGLLALCLALLRRSGPVCKSDPPRAALSPAVVKPKAPPATSECCSPPPAPELEPIELPGEATALLQSSAPSKSADRELRLLKPKNPLISPWLAVNDDEWRHLFDSLYSSPLKPGKVLPVTRPRLSPRPHTPPPEDDQASGQDQDSTGWLDEYWSGPPTTAEEKSRAIRPSPGGRDDGTPRQ